jgi:FlgD Ig-like domain
MRKLLCIAFAVLVGAGASSAFGMTLDYQGYAFETAGFPPSEVGDELAMPLIVNAFAPTFAATLGLGGEDGEITGWVSGLVSTGTQDAGDGVLMVTYSQGRVEFFRDPASNHDFGTLPPNATVPSTFTDGALCLSGSLNEFVLYFDTETQTGAFQADLVFDSGDCLKELGAASAEGFTFGGVLSPQAVGIVNVPAGYDLQVDGYLEARKVAPPETCEFQCMGIDEARLDFKRYEHRRCGPKDGKFTIEGGFLPCETDSLLDPELLEVTLRLGDFQQVFPEGTLERHDRHDGDIKWEFENERGAATITDFEIRYDGCGSWSFEIDGRGIDRSMLLPEDNLLKVELCIGNSCGSAEASLVQKKSRLRYKSKHDHCECESDHRDDDDKPAPAITALGPELLPATPNPFNATTTIALRTTIAGDVRVRIFDVRGRLVRDVQNGSLPAGDHRFVWRGENDQGASVASGVYVYRVDAPGLSTSRKLVVAK